MIDSNSSALEGCDMTTTHIITCEYPPMPGGVSDYTYNVANGLAAAGRKVHVWCPGTPGTQCESAVHVHRQLGKLSLTDLYRFDHLLNSFRSPRNILVQWVPQGYGYQSMNLPFCLWLWYRSAHCGDHVELFVHEPFLFFEGSYRQYVAAAIHRLMIIPLLAAVRRVWMSIPGWEPLLKPYLFHRSTPFCWLPIPSNVPVNSDARRVNAVRLLLRPEGGMIVGHFGTYGKGIKSILKQWLLHLRRDKVDLRLLLLGRGNSSFRGELIAEHPALGDIIFSPGDLSLCELSIHLQACDFMIQPFPDGITTRRTSAMACLAHSRAVITTSGQFTEDLWRATNAVCLTSPGDVDDMVKQTKVLATNGLERARMSSAVEQLYSSRFHLKHTLAALATTI